MLVQWLQHHTMFDMCTQGCMSYNDFYLISKVPLIHVSWFITALSCISKWFDNMTTQTLFNTVPSYLFTVANPPIWQLYKSKSLTYTHAPDMMKLMNSVIMMAEQHDHIWDCLTVQKQRLARNQQSPVHICECYTCSYLPQIFLKVFYLVYTLV